MWASFHPSYTVLKRNSVTSKNKGTSIWNFVLNSGLENFATAYRSSKLSSSKVDAQSVINWAVVGQLSRQYLRAPTLDHYSLSHRSSSAVYSTILWFCRTGQLETADTWFRTCRTCSFCTVEWQLARFQLTRRIAWSLGDSWASCWFLVPSDLHRPLSAR